MMRRLTATAMVAAVMLAGCADLTAYRYWQFYAMTSPAVSADKRFDDGTVRTAFFIDGKKIHFSLENVGDEPLTIQWNRARYLHIDGRRHAAVNGINAFTDRRTAPPAQTVAPGERIEDWIVPTANVELLEQWTWYVYPLFERRREASFATKGKTFGVDLPVKVGDREQTYPFRFRIEAVQPYHYFAD